MDRRSQKIIALSADIVAGQLAFDRADRERGESFHLPNEIKLSVDQEQQIEAALSAAMELVQLVHTGGA